ncbi:YrbI family 3-deoxy-D-manno-octulosonate 8-phosphate phosphatase [Microbacterium sp. W4I4]|uniref:acylneuraminate cytidylyltransferase n=1 Tax=Microbacterium sp. W4I4 TaxID=3042295 RepID=UPI00278B9232|nr:acylneuraminate cytidylyltransferase [Microbacterium sp. W4I4]MDQ0614667.1 YrbI family 3-deoxy-D-manno-octulosonate 8-phosphate phosphatase [Microbacterium sp. W4I4]
MSQHEASERGLTVAIIPARGGSKGVPGKNLRRVGGMPLIERAVRAASAASGVDLVVVSTDDERIAAVAEGAGARVVARPADLSGDTATSESALMHALDMLEADGIRVGTIVFVQATSPFIPSEGIAEAVDHIVSGRFDSVFSAHETYGFLWRRDADGHAVAINHDAAHRPRRQDREPHHLETGAFYAFDAAGFRRFQHRFFGLVGIVDVPERTAIEIDDEHQLAVAEALAAATAGVDAGAADAAITASALVTDFDGVHTDDTATVDSEGRESVRVSREDGMGVSRLRRAGIPMLILSTEQNPVVARRAEKLQVPVLHGIDDKAAALTAWATENGIRLADIAYVGNDVNDLGSLGIVGWPIAVANAHPEVKAAARVVLTRRGGEGAVREVIERMLPR